MKPMLRPDPRRPSLASDASWLRLLCHKANSPGSRPTARLGDFIGTRAGAGSITAAFLLSLLLWLGTSGCQPETPASEPPHVRYVIGLSPFLEDSVKDEVFRHLVRFLLEEMPMNSSMWLYDAYHVRTIAQINIPSARAFESARTRANQFKDRIQEVKEFLAAHHEKPGTNDLNWDNAVRLPQFVEFVGENLSGPKHAVVVLLLGSPLYLDDKEMGFSMVDGYFPSDGHLLADREKSVYGLQDRSETLQGAAVHWAYFGDPWLSEIHREKIGRFWTLYVKGQGGCLATFCGDLPTLFNAVAAGAESPQARHLRHEIDPAQTKIEMLRITRDVGVADWITRDRPSNLAQGPPSTTVGPMKIGIRWQGDIDLDLYSRPARQSETLFFRHTRSPEGYYFKDHRSSPEREYEFIEFLSPVDVRRVEASVNLYQGSAPGGPEGEVRVEFDGKVYVGRFRVRAESGNHGRSGGDQGDWWTTINLPALLMLR